MESQRWCRLARLPLVARPLDRGSHYSGSFPHSEARTSDLSFLPLYPCCALLVMSQRGLPSSWTLMHLRFLRWSISADDFVLIFKAFVEREVWHRIFLQHKLLWFTFSSLEAWSCRIWMVFWLVSIVAMWLMNATSLFSLSYPLRQTQVEVWEPLMPLLAWEQQTWSLFWRHSRDQGITTSVRRAC